MNDQQKLVATIGLTAALVIAVTGLVAAVATRQLPASALVTLAASLVAYLAPSPLPKK